MRAKQLRPVCSFGMFDLMKGIAIISVIFGHTSGLIITAAHHPVVLPLTSLGNFFLCGFVVAAGFGIRKRPIRKCAVQLKNMFLLPYVLSASAMVILRSVNDFFLYGSFSSTLKQLLGGIVGCLLAVKNTFEVGGFEVGDCGVLWFLVALAGGWFILNLILNYSQGRKQHLLVVLSGLIGFYGNLFSVNHGIPLLFCLFFMFVFVPGLYLGYLARTQKWFEKKLSPVMIVLILVSLAAFAWRYDNPFALAVPALCPLGVFTHYAAFVLSFGIVYLMTHINRWENPVTSFLETLGNRSIILFCLHSVEEHGIPWETLRWLLPNTDGPHSFFVILVLRLCFIALGMLVVADFQKWGGFKHLGERLFHKKIA